MQLEIDAATRDCRAVVEQEHRRIAAGHELLEAEDLPTIPQRVLRKQPQLGQAIEGDPRRCEAPDLIGDELDYLAEFDLPWVQQILFAVGIERIAARGEFKYVYPVQRPAVRASHGAQFLG